MSKIGNIKQYYYGTRMYYLFLYQWFYVYDNPDVEKHIIKKDVVCSAEMAFISNILLSIKEDIIDNKGNRVYESKIFLDSLMTMVDRIAKQDGKEYIINGVRFPDAASVVVTIRNRIAHGEYEIDFEHNRVLIKNNGNDFILNIDRLASFIVDGLANFLKSKETNSFSHDFTMFPFEDTTRKVNFKTDNEILDAIRKTRHICLTISSKDGSNVPGNVREKFEEFYKAYGNVYNRDEARYRFVKSFRSDAEKNGYIVTITESRLKKNEDIQKVFNHIKAIMSRCDLSYHNTLVEMIEEIQRILNPEYERINPLISHLKNLNMISAIDSSKQTSVKSLMDYFAHYKYPFKYSFDELVAASLSCFNPLISYPLDDVYKGTKPYSLNRDDCFDFGNLDLSILHPTILSVDYSAIDNARDDKEAKDYNVNVVLNGIKKLQNSLNNVKDNEGVIKIISGNLEKAQNLYDCLCKDQQDLTDYYDQVQDDFILNKDYFVNKAIVNGIRNSIAHGHYFVKMGEDNAKTIITFRDVFEGKTTFELEVTLKDFDNCFFVINQSSFWDYIDKLEAKEFVLQEYDKSITK